MERVNLSRVELARPPDELEENCDTSLTSQDFSEKKFAEEWVVRRVNDQDRDFDGKLWFHIEWMG